jgi:hypothetical protein
MIRSGFHLSRAGCIGYIAEVDGFPMTRRLSSTMTLREFETNRSSK